jgi:N-acetylmuramoyl-L-alanine amidase
MAPLPVWAEDCRVAVDVGHTRDKPGEISARGRPEREFNLALAKRLDSALASRGIRSLLINPEGEAMALHDRPRLAAEAGASLLISIHHDSVQDHYKTEWEWGGRRLFHADQFSGYGLFISALNPAYDESLRVATNMGKGLLAAGLRPSLHHAEAIPGEGRPLVDVARGVYRYDDLVVLKYATIPAVLVEAAIIVNRAEERKAREPAFQAKVAEALAAAAQAHCLAKQPQR